MIFNQMFVMGAALSSVYIKYTLSDIFA